MVRMRDELLNETLFFTTGQTRSTLVCWVNDYEIERPHSLLDFDRPAASAAELEQQRTGVTSPDLHLCSCATTPAGLWLTLD